MARNKIPVSVSDTLMHIKDSDKTERVILPITRYGNVLNAPKVVGDVTTVMGAPFVLLETSTETLTTAEIRRICGPII